ncbi:MAG: response regulator [Anaerolineae bacterium]|nr:response regulator [Anaerolineae bacterium]
MSEGKVVIIEPDPIIIEMLQGPFQEANFEVGAATSAAEGLALCRRTIPQAVLVDAHLPDMDGFQVCKQLRATTRTQHAHLVIMARGAKREHRLAALGLGTDDFIGIPFDPDEVTLRIRNALRRAAAENLTDPVTGLPSGRLVRKRLRDLLREGPDWALIGVTLRYLNAYESSHGFFAVQDALAAVVQGMSDAVERSGGREDFLGYSGGGRFLVVTTAERVDELAREMQANIEAKLQPYHTPEERQQGYVTLNDRGEEHRLPLIEVAIRKVAPADGPFYDIRSLTEALG